MLVPNRHGTSDSYRYGFQGQERDDVIKGEGNSVNYKYRMHDPRIGRFFAVDPLFFKYPNLSSYQFSANTPIMAVELEGLESSEDPNVTQQPLDGPQKEFVMYPKSGIPLSEVTVIATKKTPVPSNYNTREFDYNSWTTEVGKYGTNGSFEQWKIDYGIPGESYSEAVFRNNEEWGSYWETKFAKWDKDKKDERLRSKLFIFLVYFYMAEDVMLSYTPANAISAATARVTSKSYSFSGILSRNSDDIIAYRNFGPNEYKAFRNNGNRFSLKEGSFGEKQFWLDEKGLEMWLNNPTFAKPFTIKIRVPKSLLEYERMLDGKRALSFDRYSIQKLNNNFKIEHLEIRPGNGLGNGF